MRFTIIDGMIYDAEHDEFLGIEDVVATLNTLSEVQDGYERLRAKMREQEL